MSKYPHGSYRIIGDFHTHTLASQHAYSTINEMIQASIARGFKTIAITDHAPEMLDGAISHHFLCMNGLPDWIGDFRLYKGAEVNIKDFQGRIDLERKVLANLDWIIASYHVEAIDPGNTEENTEGWLNMIKHPYVDCLGHPGNPVYPFEHEKIVKALRDAGKVLEINSNSFQVRKGSEPNCRHLIELCKKYEVPVLANSDAHHLWRVGDVQASLDLLEELDYPPELILNSNFEAISSYIERRRQEKLRLV